MILLGRSGAARSTLDTLGSSDLKESQTSRVEVRVYLVDGITSRPELSWSTPGALKKLLNTSGEDGFKVGLFFAEFKFWSVKPADRGKTTFSYCFLAGES